MQSQRLNFKVEKGHHRKRNSVLPEVESSDSCRTKPELPSLLRLIMSTILHHFGVSVKAGKADKENMGIQSQHRKPSTQRIRERRQHQLKSKQNSREEEDKEEFNPEVDCKVCRAKSTNSTVPHRKHHEQCPQRRKEKGQLDPDQQTFGQALAEHEKGRAIESQDQIDKFFAPRKSLFPTSTSKNGGMEESIRAFTANEWRDNMRHLVQSTARLRGRKYTLSDGSYCTLPYI
jgi:hypothetical protein